MAGAVYAGSQYLLESWGKIIDQRLQKLTHYPYLWLYIDCDIDINLRNMPW